MFTSASKMPQQYPRSGIFPPNFDNDHDCSSGGDDDATLNGLKEIVSRQQREIENHQQKLVAKEQRLKYLKQPETIQLADDALRAMQEKVHAQELKLERLRELRGQVDQQRLLNVSELDSVKALFKDKERELLNAVAKVDLLTRQLDTVKKSQLNKSSEPISITNNELEKLKQDLRFRNEGNEQKNQELSHQLELLRQRNSQVDYLDKRIEDLQNRLKKRKAGQAPQTNMILGPIKNQNANVATVEPSIRREPTNNTIDDVDKLKISLIPNSQDPRYQTLPYSFKFRQDGVPDNQSVNFDTNKEEKNPDKNTGKLATENKSNGVNQKRVSPDPTVQKNNVLLPIVKAAPGNEASRSMMLGPTIQTAKYGPPPAYRRDVPQSNGQNDFNPRPQVMYTSSAQLPNRPQISQAISGDANNNNRRSIHDYQKNEKPDPSVASVIPLRVGNATTSVTAPYKPVYASRSVIADTYMKRIGPRASDPRYNATMPHSIPAFHLTNSIISDKVSSKNNTLRSLRRRHSYTETDETKIELALGPREPTPGASEVPREDSPKPKAADLDSSTESRSSTGSQSDVKVPNSGIVARMILRKEIGVKRNLDRRVSFDPHALLLDASLEGEYELVKRSASEVKDASAPNDEGITALHNAICAGHFDIVKFLVKFGVDVNSQDIDGWTPLHCAASCNNLPMVKFLVENGACIYAATVSDHETPAEKCEEDEDGFDGCSQYLYGIQEKLGVLNGGHVYALFDYQAGNSDELSFKNGDQISVLRSSENEEKDWWWARLGEKEGYVPRTFLGLFPRVRP